ncbi:unnamed protein product [Lampetra fluviatilis]
MRASPSPAATAAADTTDDVAGLRKPRRAHERDGRVNGALSSLRGVSHQRRTRGTVVWGSQGTLQHNPLGPRSREPLAFCNDTLRLAAALRSSDPTWNDVGGRAAMHLEKPLLPQTACSPNHLPKKDPKALLALSHLQTQMPQGRTLMRPSQGGGGH